MVTHGLMTRVFLMKWYHWSVEYFEDLRNVNHCEFVVMRRRDDGKYGLENEMRTWTQLKKERAEREHREVREMGGLDTNPSRRNTLSAFLAHPDPVEKSPARQWGGCAEGCNHNKKAEGDTQQQHSADNNDNNSHTNERDDHALAHQEPSTHDGTSDSPTSSKPKPLPPHLTRGPPSGADTPHEMPSDDELDHQHSHSYFPTQSAEPLDSRPKSLGEALKKRPPERKPTPEDIERWTQESGMGTGQQADALGDEPAPGEQADQDGVEAFGERMLERLEEQDKSLRGSVY